MTFDLTITLGNLITILGSLLVATWFIFRLEHGIGLLQRDVRELEKDMLQLAGAAISLARHDERFALFDKAIRDLEAKINARIELQDERISTIWTAFNTWRIDKSGG